MTLVRRLLVFVVLFVRAMVVIVIWVVIKGLIHKPDLTPYDKWLVRPKTNEAPPPRHSDARDPGNGQTPPWDFSGPRPALRPD